MKSFRVVETFQHRLRTLRETLALLVELLQHFESRFFFGKRPLDFNQAFFGAGQQLSILLQPLPGFARPGHKTVDVFFLALRNRAPSGKFPFNFVAACARFRNRCVEFLQMFARRFPANRDAGQFVLESVDPLFAFREHQFQLFHLRIVCRPLRAQLRHFVGQIFQFRFFRLQ